MTDSCSLTTREGPLSMRTPFSANKLLIVLCGHTLCQAVVRCGGDAQEADSEHWWVGVGWILHKCSKTCQHHSHRRHTHVSGDLGCLSWSPARWEGMLCGYSALPSWPGSILKQFLTTAKSWAWHNLSKCSSGIFQSHILTAEEDVFSSQHSRGGSQPSITLVLGLMWSSDLWCHEACMWYTSIHVCIRYAHGAQPYL